MGAAPRRYILRYRPAGAKPQAEVERVRRLGGVRVIDESGPKMLLIECDEEPPAGLSEALPDWVVAPEQTMSIPEPPRRRVEGSGS